MLDAGVQFAGIEQH